MSVFSTTNMKFMMPDDKVKGIISDTKNTSVVASLSGRTPMSFGEKELIVVDQKPKGQFLDENTSKGSTDFGLKPITLARRKVQVTKRFTDEVMWADEAEQLDVLNTFIEEGSASLSRALDIGLIHRVNPHTGNVIDSWTNYLSQTTNVVESDGSTDADAELRAGSALLTNNSKKVNGLALDPIFLSRMASLTTQDGIQRYPTLGIGTDDVTSLLGVKTAVSDTVSAREESADTGIRAILGDFKSGIQWGVQKQLPAEVIPYGDPDNTGIDLKNFNQIAIRLEIVFAWYVFTDKFAVIKDNTALAGA